MQESIYTFQDSECSFEYKIIYKKRLKNSYIRITDKGVVVTANSSSSLTYLQEWVASKSSWIAKHLKNNNDATIHDLTLKDSKIYLLGEAYLITTEIDSSLKYENMRIQDSKAIFELTSSPTHERLTLLRDDYYKSLCPATIDPIIAEQSSIMNLYPSKVTYRRTKSRWGSCSSKNNISLNTRLMMLPPTNIKYIVIHELAHIKEKNHSVDFWNLVERYYPDWKKQKSVLKHYGKLF